MVPDCERYITCSGNGICNGYGECICEAGYSGYDCSNRGSSSAVGAIIGVVAGIVIVGAIVGIIIVRRRRMRYTYKYPSSTEMSSPTPRVTYVIPTTVVNRLLVSSSEHLAVKQLFFDKWEKGDPEKIK
jgi:hypothetical protein